jgi:hypothetical protein
LLFQNVFSNIERVGENLETWWKLKQFEAEPIICIVCIQAWLSNANKVWHRHIDWMMISLHRIAINSSWSSWSQIPTSHI